MSRNTFVRRPWVNYWQSIRYDKKDLDQQCKLIRNLVASMDLGLPGFKLYDSHISTPDRQRWWVNSPRKPLPSGRERYLEWVSEWKATYAELSQCIRDLKSQRKLDGFLAVRDKIEKFAGSNLSNHAQLLENSTRVRDTLEALRISAQIMLNARAIGKLASGQLRQRALDQQMQRELEAA